jgi:hypothetical protein
MALRTEQSHWRRLHIREKILDQSSSGMLTGHRTVQYGKELEIAHPFL